MVLLMVISLSRVVAGSNHLACTWLVAALLATSHVVDREVLTLVCYELRQPS